MLKKLNLLLEINLDKYLIYYKWTKWTKYSTFYSSSKSETIMRDVVDVLESLCYRIVWNIQKWLGKRSGWVIDSVVHYSSILKYKP